MFSRAGGPSLAGGTRTTSRDKSFRAPIRGLVLNENLAGAKPQGALILENWTPISRGARMRRGSTLFATVGTDPVESMMSYFAGAAKKLFAVADGEIFDITSVADPEVAPTPDVTGLNGSYFSYVNFTTSGGPFMPCVNGADPLLLYDGTSFYPITGVALSALNYDAETVTFVEGGVLTGGTSAATGEIVKVIDAGTTGTLWIRVTSGTFQNNETITGSLGGSATSDGVISSLAGAITGATTSDLSHVWVYRNRLFFVKKNSQTAYYLAVDSVTGALGSVSLAGIFQRGGNLLLGATWSLDAGDGIDDKCVFISDQGEIVVFEGNDPSSADPADWYLVGRYDGAQPLGRRATMTAGGDLLVASKTGLVAVSASITKDPAAIGVTAVTRAIEPLWTSEAVRREAMPWEIVKWPDRQIAIVSTPVVLASDDPQCFIVNLETGAWAVYTGWNTRCLALHDDIVYFGTNDGTIMEAEAGGNDNGLPYYCRMAWNWDHCGDEGAFKEFTSVRAIFRASRPFNPDISVSTDYVTEWPTAPNAADGVETSLWDEGLWDVALWDGGGGDTPTVTLEWSSLQNSGVSVSPQIQITSGSDSAPDCEIVSLQLVWNTGAVLT